MVSAQPGSIKMRLSVSSPQFRILFAVPFLAAMLAFSAFAEAKSPRTTARDDPSASQAARPSIDDAPMPAEEGAVDDSEAPIRRQQSRGNRAEPRHGCRGAQIERGHQYRQVDPGDDGLRRRHRAALMAGFDRQPRLLDPIRGIHCQLDEQDLVQQAVGQRAHAACGLLHQEGPRHSRHDRGEAARQSGLAWLRAPCSEKRRDPVLPGEGDRHGECASRSHRRRRPAARDRKSQARVPASGKPIHRPGSSRATAFTRSPGSATRSGAACSAGAGSSQALRATMRRRLATNRAA